MQTKQAQPETDSIEHPQPDISSFSSSLAGVLANQNSGLAVLGGLSEKSQAIIGQAYHNNFGVPNLWALNILEDKNLEEEAASENLSTQFEKAKLWPEMSSIMAYQDSLSSINHENKTVYETKNFETNNFSYQNPLPVYVVNEKSEKSTQNTYTETGKNLGLATGASLGSIAGPIGSALGGIVGYVGGGRVGQTADEIAQAQNNEEKGKSIGRLTGDLTKAINFPLGMVFGEQIVDGNEKAGGFIGSLFDKVQTDDAIQAQEEAKLGFSKQPVTHNNIHFRIDKNGIPHLESQDRKDEQTKFNVEVGYTRLYQNEA